MTDDRGNNGNNREIVVWVGLESIILWLLSLVLETVLPPIPCHLMSRSPSKLKFSAMCVLKLRRRKSCSRRMAQNKKHGLVARRKNKREYNQIKGITCLKRFARDPTKLMTRERRHSVFRRLDWNGLH